MPNHKSDTRNPERMVWPLSIDTAGDGKMGGGALTDFATTRRSGPPESKPPSLNARERGGDAPPLSSEAPTNGARGAPAIAAAPGWPAHRTTSHALLFVTLWRRFQGGPTHCPLRGLKPGFRITQFWSRCPKVHRLPKTVLLCCIFSATLNTACICMQVRACI